MNCLILIGPSGTGKSSCARLLGEKLHLAVVDCDERICAQENMAIAEIFRKFGEDYFRRLEIELLNQLEASKEAMVIATGGGMPTFADNLERLKKLGTTIYLSTRVDVLERRLEGDVNRPLLNLSLGESLQNKLSEQLSKREAIYRKACLQIDTSQLSAQEVVERILTSVKLQSITKDLS